MKKIGVVVIGALLTASSFAQTLTSDSKRKTNDVIKVDRLSAETCSGIKESKKRLICFDTLAKQASNENGQAAKRNESTGEIESKVKPLISANKVILIDAGLVYASGDVKPVARTNFYILNESLGAILKSAGINATPNTVSEEFDSIVNIGYFGNVHVMIDKLTSIRDTSSPEIQNAKYFYSRALTAIEPHIVQRGITDFSGRVKFDSLAPGTYYVMGVYKTPKGAATWNLKVVLNDEETKITLDQNNATSAR